MNNTLPKPPVSYAENLSSDAESLASRIDGANGRLHSILLRATGSSPSTGSSDSSDLPSGVFGRTREHLSVASANVTELHALIDVLESLI